ncbi:MAG: hypothetical protein AAFY66_03950 [Pseudomonadota bacterium]
MSESVTIRWGVLLIFRKPKPLRVFFLALGLSFGLSGEALAQEPKPKHLTLLGIPSATTAPGGLVFGQVSRSFDIDSDADDLTVLSLGFGIGSAEENIGGQFTVTGAPSSEEFDSFAYFGAKVSRRLTATENPTYVGLLVNRIAASGEAEDLDPAVSLIFTSFGATSFAATEETYPFMVSVGAGSHVRDGGEDPGVFFGAGVGVTSALGVSAAWSGDQVDFGASLRFEQLRNARFSVVLSDAFNLEDRRQATLALSWAFDTGQWR